MRISIWDKVDSLISQKQGLENLAFIMGFFLEKKVIFVNSILAQIATASFFLLL